MSGTTPTLIPSECNFPLKVAFLMGIHCLVNGRIKLSTLYVKENLNEGNLVCFFVPLQIPLSPTQPGLRGMKEEN